jgi:glycosyltransferase involved in cell wall biosynthesis
MRVTFVQFGNYAEAVERLAQGLGEGYYAQAYSVDYVGELASRCDVVTTISLNASGPARWLSNGVYWLGIDRAAAGAPAAVIGAIEEQAPTHLILRIPLLPVLHWAMRRDVRTLPLLADSFQRGEVIRHLRRHLSQRRLARALNAPAFEWVANHNTPASEDLVRIGVHPGKVIPWDFPPLVSPADRPPKTTAAIGAPVKLLYVGSVTSAKGAFDLLDALARLNASSRRYFLTLAGPAPPEAELARQLARRGVADCVRVAGRVSQQEVMQLMVTHDVVVVPSQHKYPEGLPMTLYEGLSSRTPLVVSDHPMFVGKFRHRESAMVFEGSNPASLAAAIEELVNDPACYARISENAQATWNGIRCPVEWHELLDRWLRNAPEDRDWLATHSLGD